MVWTKPNTVAVNTGTSSIRLWNLDTGDNSLLTLPDGSHHAEHFTSISYCPTKGVLCGGTNAGNLMMWKRSDEDWELENSSSASAPVKQLLWGNELLAVNTIAHLYVLKQQPLSAHYNQQVGGVQTSGSHVVLIFQGSNQKIIKSDISCEIQIHGVTVSNKYCVLWSDKTVVSYVFAIDAKDVISVQVAGMLIINVLKKR